ncbi:hypothetical protein LZK73_16735 [Neorhizobium galegae]|nr:hypothetical protein LZK73_16735 [Neorhizobium galegae]
MSALKKTISLGLVALSVAGALTVTAPAAEARDRHHRDVWPGVAAGLAGGIIGGAIVAGSQRPAYAEPEYVEPEYDYAPPPPPPVYYRRAYYRDYPPVCEFRMAPQPLWRTLSRRSLLALIRQADRIS